jgi:hypothetical protein
LHFLSETVVIKEEKRANKQSKKESEKINLELKQNKKLLSLVKNAYTATAEEDG